MLQYLPMATVTLLLGGECTGKTALARHLTNTLADGRPSEDVVVIPEVLRDFVARTGRTPTRDEQRGIWLEQSLALAEHRDGFHGLVICDPAPLMTAVYSVQYFDDDSLMSTALEATNDADLVVWCFPDLPWEPDGVMRDGPQARQRTHEILESLVVPHLVRTRVVPVFGDLAHRAEQVSAHLP